jgi:hypothetical protein
MLTVGADSQRLSGNQHAAHFLRLVYPLLTLCGTQILRQDLIQPEPSRSIGRPIDHGRCRAGRRYRVRVPMNELPDAVFPPEHAGHAEDDRNGVHSASDPGTPPFDLNNTREIAGDMLRDQVDPYDLSVTVIQGGGVAGFLDPLSAMHERPEGIAKGNVVRA